MKKLFTVTVCLIFLICSNSEAQLAEVEGEIVVSTPNSAVTFEDRTSAFTQDYSLFHENGNLFVEFGNQNFSARNFRINGSNLYLGEAVNGAGARLYVGNFGDGSHAIANAWNVYSDENLKKDIIQIQSGKNIITRLNPVKYAWKDSNIKDVGFLAQEVETLIPYIVDTDDATGLKTMDYTRLIPFLVKALQEQNEEIELLKTELEALKK